MEKRHLSEGALARLSGVTQPTIHRILTGESKDPRRSNLEKIVGVFGKSVEALYAGELLVSLNELERAHKFTSLLEGLSDEQLDAVSAFAKALNKNL
tara:strand:- start:7 stop:297 length:291 start_codon:yes stop_codon:yes gene_type:complete